MRKVFGIILIVVGLVAIIAYLFLIAHRREAQIIKQKRVYQYRVVTPMDAASLQPKEVMAIDGVIEFTEADDKEFISVIVDSMVFYHGPIIDQTTIDKDQTKTNIYLFVSQTSVLPQEILLRLFEVYDLTDSDVIPCQFIVVMHDPATGERTLVQLFEDIEQIG